MWPEGKQSITEVTKRPLTAATLFKNSIVALVDNLASKVTGVPSLPSSPPQRLCGSLPSTLPCMSSAGTFCSKQVLSHRLGGGRFGDRGQRKQESAATQETQDSGLQV